LLTGSWTVESSFMCTLKLLNFTLLSAFICCITVKVVVRNNNIIVLRDFVAESFYLCAFSLRALHKVRHARGGGGPRRCDSL